MKMIITFCLLVCITCMTAQTNPVFDNTQKKSSKTNTTNPEDCIYGDCDNGFGKKQFEKNYYVGFFKDGKRDGYGFQVDPGIGKYIGNWKNDIMDGYGEYLFENNNNAIGYYKNGTLNGMGYSVVNDVWEQGIYKDGKLIKPYPYESHGIQTGCTYGDCKKGYGTMVYPNGDMFTGFFEKGNQVMGSYYFTNGNQYYGIYNALRQPDVFGRFAYANGSQYSGEFKNGMRHGRGYFLGLSQTEDKTGQWENGVLIVSMMPK